MTDENRNIENHTKIIKNNNKSITYQTERSPILAPTPIISGPLAFASLRLQISTSIDHRGALAGAGCP